jgi:hypothetical protein
VRAAIGVTGQFSAVDTTPGVRRHTHVFTAVKKLSAGRGV